MIKVISKRNLQPGVFEEYYELVKELVANTRKEEGCISYEFCVSADRTVAVFAETWKDMFCFEDHLAVLQKGQWSQRLNAFALPETTATREEYVIIE